MTSAIKTRLTWAGATPQDWRPSPTSRNQPGDHYFLPVQVASPVPSTGRHHWTMDIEVQLGSRRLIVRQAGHVLMH